MKKWNVNTPPAISTSSRPALKTSVSLLPISRPSTTPSTIVYEPPPKKPFLKRSSISLLPNLKPKYEQLYIQIRCRQWKATMLSFRYMTRNINPKKYRSYIEYLVNDLQESGYVTVSFDGLFKKLLNDHTIDGIKNYYQAENCMLDDAYLNYIASHKDMILLFIRKQGKVIKKVTISHRYKLNSLDKFFE